MPSVYFQNEKTGKRYKVISLNKESGEIILQGEHAQFTEHYDKDRFKNLGYSLVKVPDEDEDDAVKPKLRA